MLEATNKFIGLDQYGQTYWIKRHPRKELMEQVGLKSARKIYVDGPGNSGIHVGYVVGQLWIDVFKIAPAFAS